MRHQRRQTNGANAPIGSADDSFLVGYPIEVQRPRPRFPRRYRDHPSHRNPRKGNACANVLSRRSLSVGDVWRRRTDHVTGTRGKHTFVRCNAPARYIAPVGGNNSFVHPPTSRVAGSLTPPRDPICLLHAASDRSKPYKVRTATSRWRIPVTHPRLVVHLHL